MTNELNVTIANPPPPPHTCTPRRTHVYLDDKGLVLEARTHPQLAHVSRLIDEVLDAVEDAAARGGDSTMDSSLADGFAGDAGVSVDVLMRTKSEKKQMR